jgi:hypothetical protein
MDAAVTRTVSSKPPVSTARWRLVPLIFFPASYPRSRRATISEPFTDWESMIAAVGCGVRPAAERTLPRKSSCMRAVEPSASHLPAHQYTVQAGGKSAGSARHTGPLCVT